MPKMRKCSAFASFSRFLRSFLQAAHHAALYDLKSGTAVKRDQLFTALSIFCGAETVLTRLFKRACAEKNRRIVTELAVQHLPQMSHDGRADPAIAEGRGDFDAIQNINAEN